MYYNGFFGVLKERNGKFEGYIKDIPEDIYYSGATEEEAQAAFRREVDKYIAERRKRRRVIAWVVSGVVVALVVALASSCPDSRKHKDKFSEVVLASVMNDKDMGELGMLSSLFGVDNIFAKYCFLLYFMIQKNMTKILLKKCWKSFRKFRWIFWRRICPCIQRG